MNRSVNRSAAGVLRAFRISAPSLAMLLAVCGLFPGVARSAPYEPAKYSITAYYSPAFYFAETSEGAAWMQELSSLKGSNPCSNFWADSALDQGSVSNVSIPSVEAIPEVAAFLQAHPRAVALGRKIRRSYGSEVYSYWGPNHCLTPSSYSITFLWKINYVECPKGYAPSSMPEYGLPPPGAPMCSQGAGDYPDVDKERGNSCDCVGDPIHPLSGNRYEQVTDYQGAGPYPISITRTYNSIGTPGWTWNFERRVTSISLFNGVQAAGLTRPDGRIFWFNASGGSFSGDADIVGTLSAVPGVGWTFKNELDEVESYGLDGRLTALTNRAGLTQTYSRGAAGELLSISDQFGNVVSFSGNQFTTPSGATYQYNFDGR